MAVVTNRAPAAAAPKGPSQGPVVLFILRPHWDSDKKMLEVSHWRREAKGLPLEGHSFAVCSGRKPDTDFHKDFQGPDTT